MYCKNCGREIEDGKEYCVDCEPKTEVVTEEGPIQEVNASNTTTNTNTELKSKMAAGLLGIFLGSLGVHNFYLGYTGKAIAQLLMSVLSCGFLAIASQIWGLIEGIMILTGSIDKDANGNPLKD